MDIKQRNIFSSGEINFRIYPTELNEHLKTDFQTRFVFLSLNKKQMYADVL